MAFHSPRKAELIQSFLRSKTRGVSAEHQQLARRCVEDRVSLTYERMDFFSILKENNCDYQKIAVAFDFLLKYITNLLSKDLPQNWWSINIKLPQFVHRIGNVRGAKEVLKTAGYCVEQHGTLSYPEDKRQGLDRELLSIVSAELLIAKFECERARQGGHDSLPSPLMKQQQQGVVKDESPGEEELHHNVSNRSSEPHHPHRWTDSDKLANSDRLVPPDYPGRPHHFSAQPSSHFQPTSAPHAEEYQQPVATHRQPVATHQQPIATQQQPVATHLQHERVTNLLHPVESLGFHTSPTSGYGEDSEGLGGQQHHHHQEQPLPSDLSRSSNDIPRSQGNLVHDAHLTTEQQKQTGQEPFQLEQATGEKQATGEEQFTGEEEAEEEGEEDFQELASSGIQAESHCSSVDQMEKAASDDDPSLPDAQDSTTPSWKERSQMLLKIMRHGSSASNSSGFPRGPHTTAFDMRPYRRNASPPPDVEQRDRCVRFAPFAEGKLHEEEAPPANDPSDPNQVEKQECKNCKNKVLPGSVCSYCHVPCPKKRTRKIRTAEQLATPASTAQEGPKIPPSVMPTEKAVLPPSAGDRQQNPPSPPPPQASPPQPVNPALSERTGEVCYPPSYHKDSSSYQKPVVAGSLFLEQPSPSDAAASAQVYHHPTDFDHNPPELKRHKEAEWFGQCSPERQQEFLREKRALGDKIDHLPVCNQGVVNAPLSKGDSDLAAAPRCSIESYREKRESEARWFSRLSPAEQRAKLKEKEQFGDNVDHLLPLLKEERKQGKPGRKMVDEKVMATLEEERRREQMKRDGAIFVHHIKTCTKYGFAPEEVEIAYKRNRMDPLNYLKKDWLHEIERVQLEVRGYNMGGQSIGEPTMNEVRLALIESRGDRQVAIASCSKKRRAKIHELMGMVNQKDPVSWKDAVEVLTACNLHVEEAFNELQRRRLQPLYDFIFGDYKAFTKNMTEMDFLKELAMKGAKKEGIEYEAHLRMLTAECKFHTTAKAKLLIKLLEDNSEYPMRYYIDAASNYNTFEDAQRFLNQPCPICTIDYPMDEMVVMPGPCGHSMCKDCFRGHFEITIREKSVKHFNCPECGQPDIGDLGEIKDFYLELFVALIKEHVSSCYELCQQKLRDYALSKEPGFVWCSSEDCRSGFINERPQRYRLDCPTCHKPMCFHCKKPWEPQHERITCEQFANWKADNDPEAQKAGLAAHLEENGIECPECKMRYDLAQGGCMHFRCTQCPCEFCSGCNGRFKNGQACVRFASCKSRGLHAHHPRDCLYYLRDFPVADLQKLLTEKGIDFDTEPRQSQIDAQQEQGRQKEQEDENAAPPEHPEVKEASLEPEVAIIADEEEELAIGGDQLAVVAVADAVPLLQLTCCVMLQKEVPNGLIDEKCGKKSPKGMAGLCEVHYKEYLVRKINKNHLDPVELYDLNGVKQILNREELELPEQEDDENDVDYQRKLIEQIQKELPIEEDVGAPG